MNDYAFRHRSVADRRQRNLGAGGAFNVSYRRHGVLTILPRIESQPRLGAPFAGNEKLMAIGRNRAIPSCLSRLLTLDAGVPS
jgi:hypothetical protein